MAIEAEALLARLEAAVSEIHDHITTPEGMAAWNRLNDADSALRSALAEDTARAAEGWEPIETAPKDGTQIILFAQAWEMSWGIQVGSFSNGEWHTAEGSVAENDPDFDPNDEVDEDFDPDDDENTGPTHWRPLPAPPALPLTKEAADANR